MPLVHDIAPRSIVAAIALFTVLGSGCKDTRSPSEEGAAEVFDGPARRIDLVAATATISAAELKRHVAYLASDRLEGRSADTRGIELAADYLEREAKSVGLKPLFGDRYRQGFTMTVGARLGERNELIQQGGRSMRIGKDFVPFTFTSTGTTEGQLVFAGYGIRAPELGYDDFAGVDVTGKVLVIFSGEPAEDDARSPFDGKRPSRHSELRLKLAGAKQAGARAVLVVRERLRLPGAGVPAEPDSGIFALQITAGAARALLGFDIAKLRAEIDGTHKPKSRASDRAAVRVSASIVRDRGKIDNVGGQIFPPSGAGVEAVIIGAHYDHLGRGGSRSLSASEAPEIHNGANDNASGAAALIEIARALIASPGGFERRVIFVWFAGQESGQLGSAHFVRDPPVPVGAMTAMINLDMIGRLRDRRVLVLGVDRGRELRGLAERAIEQRGLIPVMGGEDHAPSDDSSFSAKGVPVIYLFTGTSEHYHQPSDDPETLNYPGTAKVAAVVVDVVRSLSAGGKRPRRRGP